MRRRGRLNRRRRCHRLHGGSLAVRAVGSTPAAAPAPPSAANMVRLRAVPGVVGRRQRHRRLVRLSDELELMLMLLRVVQRVGRDHVRWGLHGQTRATARGDRLGRCFDRRRCLRRRLRCRFRLADTDAVAAAAAAAAAPTAAASTAAPAAAAAAAPAADTVPLDVGASAVFSSLRGAVVSVAALVGHAAVVGRR